MPISYSLTHVHTCSVTYLRNHQIILEQTLRKTGKLNDEVELKNFKARAFAKRRQQELDIEINLLKIEQEKKQQELSYLREMYN